LFDTTPAAFATGPTPATPAKYTIDATFALDKKAWVYAVALEAGSPAPSANQIREREDASGNSVWNTSYAGMIASGTTSNFSFGWENNSSEIRPGKSYDLYFVTETYGRLSTPVKITATTTALQSTYPSMYVRGDIFTDGTTAKAMTLVDDNLWELHVVELKSGSFHFEVSGLTSWGVYWGDSVEPDGIADVSSTAIPLNDPGSIDYYLRFNTATGEYQIIPNHIFN